MLETKIFIIQVKIFSAVGCKVNHKYRQHHYCKHRDWRCCGHGSVSRCHFYYFLFVSLINGPIQIKPTSRTNVVVKVLEEGPEYHVIHISGDQRFICFLQCWPADVVSIRWSARVTGLGHPTAAPPQLWSERRGVNMCTPRAATTPAEWSLTSSSTSVFSQSSSSGTDWLQWPVSMRGVWGGILILSRIILWPAARSELSLPC